MHPSPRRALNVQAASQQEGTLEEVIWGVTLIISFPKLINLEQFLVNTITGNFDLK
jgi:hypothetical protein